MLSIDIDKFVAQNESSVMYGLVWHLNGLPLDMWIVRYVVYCWLVMEQVGGFRC